MNTNPGLFDIASSVLRVGLCTCGEPAVMRNRWSDAKVSVSCRRASCIAASREHRAPDDHPYRIAGEP